MELHELAGGSFYCYSGLLGSHWRCLVEMNFGSAWKLGKAMTADQMMEA